MGLIDLVKFIGRVFYVIGHEIRARYYEVALNHVGLAHPDAWLISRRMTISRGIVSDFIRQVAR